MSTCFICTTCGTQYAAAPQPPASCRICTDDRQHVGRTGQRWTTSAELADRLHPRLERDGAFTGLGIRESFAIPQRALLVPTTAGTVMWDCIALASDAAVAAATAAGPLTMIAVSHPHFYAAMVEWAEALGGVPILVHEADAAWIPRPSPLIQTWAGERMTLADNAELIHLPGHFPGSAALHHTDVASGRRSLLAGDSLHVTADRRHITVMHSVPNYIPVGPTVIEDLRCRLADDDFDDVYGFTWGLNIIGDGRAAVDTSFDRYLAAISA